MPDNIANPGSAQQDPSQVSPTADPFSKEIDQIFGSLNDDPADSGKQSSNPIFEDTSADSQDYGNMDAKQLAKMFQSKYDKTKAELDKVSQKLTEYESLDEFINSVYDDEEVRHAFLSDVAPDLVQAKDPYEALEEQLQKEFGAEFVPDDEEAKKPLSKSWRYYKRVDDLFKQSQEKKVTLPKSLTEVRLTKKQRHEEAAQKAQQEKIKVLQEMKWGDNDYDTFAQWVGKLSAADLAKIYKFATSRSTQKSPNLAGMSGGHASTPNQLMAELDNFFGK
jgi:hypothetical protein